MKIDKITFKNAQAWIVVKSKDGEYIGTWHIVNEDFVEALRNEMPNKIILKKEAFTEESIAHRR